MMFSFVKPLSKNTQNGCFNNGGPKLAALQKVSTCRTRFSVFFTWITLIAASFRLRFCIRTSGTRAIVDSIMADASWL